MEEGNTPEKQEDIEQELVNFCKDLLTEPNPNWQKDIDKVTKHIPKLINDEQNNTLMQPITIQELEMAVNQMEDGKSPGPNGFTIDFFHHCWDWLKFEVLDLVEESRKK